MRRRIDGDTYSLMSKANLIFLKLPPRTWCLRDTPGRDVDGRIAARECW